MVVLSEMEYTKQKEKLNVILNKRNKTGIKTV